ncbi:DUF2971 domain-containing protein [Paraburkholderia caribensis]|uniref:DUF2971 domain-containing protein n=1 Tax=Paraburkholderia caribensis TaxID=75105 RepID=UPI001CC6BDA5|nr:DUF2971 domain-containing protein [Paraburkholderia caribensis]
MDEVVDLEEPIWRYFKPSRFHDFMTTGELYFASARQFQDPFEGAVAVLPPGFPVDPRYTEREGSERAFEELRRLTKISCWHRASYESDAMWQLYAGAWKGVAIRTTPGRIAKAAKPFRLNPEYGQEDLWAGYVRYVDLLKERLRVSMLDRFWYKHMAFSWEREFRLAISLRMAEEYGVKVPEDGIKVQFDVSQLVDRIFIGPSLGEDGVKVVRQAAEAAGLGGHVRMSSMLGSPRYV